MGRGRSRSEIVTVARGEDELGCVEPSVSPARSVLLFQAALLRLWRFVAHEGLASGRAALRFYQERFDVPSQ
jgi:hypothetical protein